MVEAKAVQDPGKAKTAASPGDPQGQNTRGDGEPKKPPVSQPEAKPKGK